MVVCFASADSNVQQFRGLIVLVAVHRMQHEYLAGTRRQERNCALKIVVGIAVFVSEVLPLDPVLMVVVLGASFTGFYYVLMAFLGTSLVATGPTLKNNCSLCSEFTIMVNPRTLGQSKFENNEKKL